jgi:hypothetical protein
MKPAILYKYFPPERNSFLNELLIRFTPPDSFNDPFDSLPSFNGFDANFIRQKVENIGLDMAFQFALEDMPEIEKQKKDFRNNTCKQITTETISFRSNNTRNVFSTHPPQQIKQRYWDSVFKQKS